MIDMTVTLEYPFKDIVFITASETSSLRERDAIEAHVSSALGPERKAIVLPAGYQVASLSSVFIASIEEAATRISKEISSRDTWKGLQHDGDLRIAKDANGILNLIKQVMEDIYGTDL